MKRKIIHRNPEPPKEKPKRVVIKTKPAAKVVQAVCLFPDDIPNSIPLPDLPEGFVRYTPETTAHEIPVQLTPDTVQTLSLEYFTKDPIIDAALRSGIRVLVEDIFVSDEAHPHYVSRLRDIFRGTESFIPDVFSEVQK